MDSRLLLLMLSLHFTNGVKDIYTEVGKTVNIGVDIPYTDNGLLYLVTPQGYGPCVYDKGKLISSSDSHNINCFKTTHGQIRIQLVNVGLTDTGTYSWGDGSTSNINGAAFVLYLRGKPTKPIVIEEGKPVLNKPFSLQCRANSTTIPRNHKLPISYTWTKNSKTLKETSATKFNGSYLTITRFKWKKQQIFRCISSENGTESDISDSLSLFAERGPTESGIYPESRVVKLEGDPTNLTCSSQCVPGCQIMWKRGGNVVSENEQLHFSHVVRNDEDNYTCIIHNKHGQVELTASVLVEYGPSQATVTGATLPESTIKEGSSLSLQCSADCRPRCSVSWRRGEEILARDWNLTLSSIQRNQEGTYSCLVNNTRGHAETNLNLVVSYLPIVKALTVTPNSNIKQGSTVHLGCTIDSSETTIITLSRGSRELLTQTVTRDMTQLVQAGSNRKRTYNTGVNVTADCRAVTPYMCRAENNLGESQKNISVYVECVPFVTAPYPPILFVTRGSSKVLEFNITANPKPSVTVQALGKEGISTTRRIEDEVEHVTGHSYKLKLTYLDPEMSSSGNYTITLTNSLGFVDIIYELVVQDVPDPPTNLTVLEVSEESVHLAFLPGSDGEAEQHYEIELDIFVSDPKFYEVAECQFTNGTCVVIVENLKSGVRYSAKIRAKNGIGSSKFTDSVEFDTLQQEEKKKSTIFSVIRTVGIVFGVIVFCGLLGGLIYLLTCRPCRRKRVELRTSLDSLPTSSKATEEEAHQELWETVAGDQNAVAVVPYMDMVNYRHGNQSCPQVRVESLTMTTFNDNESRYINFVMTDALPPIPHTPSVIELENTEFPPPPIFID